MGREVMERQRLTYLESRSKRMTEQVDEAENHTTKDP